MLLLIVHNWSTFSACVNVSHVHDNPGHYTCDCLGSNDPCFEDGNCALEESCPESDGQPTGIISTNMQLQIWWIKFQHWYIYISFSLARCGFVTGFVSGKYKYLGTTTNEEECAKLVRKRKPSATGASYRLSDSFCWAGFGYATTDCAVCLACLFQGAFLSILV